MPSQIIQLIPSTAPFPEGAEMTPTQFLQWLVDNISFRAVTPDEGAPTTQFLTGQVGGTAPGTNVGVFFDVINRMVKLWNGTAYESLLSVPIGVMAAWPSFLTNPPNNDWIFCEGQFVLKSQFPLLTNVLGDLWKRNGDDSTWLRLPDTRGRVAVGSDDGSGNGGDYNPHNISGFDFEQQPGQITNHTIGTYFGMEWFHATHPVQAGAPTFRHSLLSSSVVTDAISRYCGVSQPSFVTRWIIRAR